MINEEIEDNNLIAADADEVELKRLDNCARQARFRARRDLQERGLTVKKLLALKATRSAALAATISAAQTAMQRLTIEQRAVWESEDLKEGLLPDGLTAPFSCLCSMMHRTVAAVKMDCHDEVRGDIELAIYNDYIQTFPWSRALIYPHTRTVDRDDPEAPLAYTMAEFFDAVKTWSAYRSHTPVDLDPYVPDADQPKRKRGRPKLVRPTEAEPAVAPLASWSKPPALPQAQHWGGIAADRVGREITRDVEEALPSKPQVFFGM
jgi:hypothetical protein